MTDLKSVAEDRFAYVRDAYIQPKGVWATSRVQRVMDAANMSQGDLVLDLACSMGTFSTQARQVGARPVGVDLN
jgi:23S rRNA G2069 N7-methylase RlmK/C1962 C5-methylase RlmI